MRGENAIDGYKELEKTGSSPHARGKRATTYDADAARGLIPACAGKTII